MADAAYGLWPLVVLNTILFVAFAASCIAAALAHAFADTLRDTCVAQGTAVARRAP